MIFMPSIRLKRGQSVNLNGLTLLAGEPAFSLDTGKFFIGNGVDKVLINPDSIAHADSADLATKLASARLIAVDGDATGSASFDGSANATISLVLANTGVGAGTLLKLQLMLKEE